MCIYKMKIVIIDITGRNASQYNPSLCQSISKQSNVVKVTLCSPTLAFPTNGYCWLKLLSLLPKKLANSSETGIIKKVLRGVETSINYLYLTFWCILRKPNIIHFQWLPFVEYSNIEPYFLWLLRAVSPRSKLFLTVHNVYPHGLAEDQKENYRNRFSALSKYITGYFVHLKSSKNELSIDFGIPQERITVAYHGIYSHGTSGTNNKKAANNHINVIMYGNQNNYKGADILVEALGLLPAEYQERIKCKIIGHTDSQLFAKCHDEAVKLHIEWINRYVSDEELYNAIDKSDLILLPYRAISQSGVLLLAMSYKKPILTSNLPSFIETLEGYPDEYFFEKENPQSLANKLIEFINGKIDKELMLKVIERLNEKYSWDETAKKTLEAYGVCKAE